MSLTDLLNVSQIYELVKKGAMLEAQEAILKYREEIVKLTEENLELKQEISDLKNKIKLEDELKYIGEAYYRVIAEGQKEGPFCQVCYDVEGKLVRMVTMTTSTRHVFLCNQCHNTFEAS